MEYFNREGWNGYKRNPYPKKKYSSSWKQSNEQSTVHKRGKWNDGVHGRITGMLYTFRFVRLDSARGGFLIFIPLFADRLAGTTCTSARGQKWVGFAIIQFRPRITRARPTKEKARQMRMAKWKIPLRTVFRPYCFPFIAADVKKNHGNDTYIRHVAPAHVPLSSASGHFRDHRAARNE